MIFFCIDTQSSVKIGPSNWVGIENTEVDETTGEISTNICSFVECNTATYAMFTLPVCQINIIDTKLQIPEYDTISYDDASITGLSCTNKNRFIEGQCDVAQIISVTEETTVELEHTKKMNHTVPKMEVYICNLHLHNTKGRVMTFLYNNQWK